MRIFLASPLFVLLCSLILASLEDQAAAFLPTPTNGASSSSLAGVLGIPRGGAWYFGKTTAARKYKQLLRDQASLLERQLRQSTEELALLRRQLKTSQTLLHRSSPQGVRSRSAEQQANKLRALAENQDLKKRCNSLESEVESLLKMKDELQAMMDRQTEKMKELEAQLSAKGEENAKLEEKYQREMEKLKKEIDAKYQKQIAELTKLMEQRVKEAAEHARQVALREVEAKIVQATTEERQRGEKLLQEERKRSEAAVEREKVKMRKLAKALFEREKKLNTLGNDLGETLSTSTKGVPSLASRSGNANIKVDTIRKF